MENCGRADSLQCKKHIMPERNIAIVCTIPCWHIIRTYAKKGHSIRNVLL